MREWVMGDRYVSSVWWCGQVRPGKARCVRGYTGEVMSGTWAVYLCTCILSGVR